MKIRLLDEYIYLLLIVYRHVLAFLVSYPEDLDHILGASPNFIFAQSIREVTKKIVPLMLPI